MAAKTDADAPVVVEQEVIELRPALKSARVKGTWTMIYGDERYDFVDGQRYEISPDLFDYLRKSGNIYDTLA